MQTVREIASAIVAREGGFVNDPDDPGGATKFGVTIHTMRRLGLDLTGDGAVDVADVRRLSRAQAVDIFVRHYFNAPRITELPAPLQPSVFDMYVNAGSNAVKILQSLLREMGQEIAVDGAIGPQTIRAAQAAWPPLIIWSTPTVSRGATTTSALRTAAPPAANTRAAGQAARAAGSGAPKSSSHRNIT